MRIRKRQVPLPISSLSPVPIWSSDPNLPLVQLQVDQNSPRNLSLIAEAASSFDLGPPDHQSQPSGPGIETVKVSIEEDGMKRGETMTMMRRRRSNDSREGGDQLGAEIKRTLLNQPGSSRDKAGGRWFEGEKSFQLKKRRGSVERRSSPDYEEAAAVDTKMKANARSGQVGQEGDEEEVRGLAMDHGVRTITTQVGARKKGRGGAIMEGSRCSRVNGRGWRCCQQTLVGYSLCEHHLGKGRLRSMSNVSRNNRSKANSQPFSSLRSPLLKSLEEDQDAKDNDGDEGDDLVDDGKKPAIIVRRKTSKFGMVKARSLTSLLGLANEAISMSKNET